MTILSRLALLGVALSLSACGWLYHVQVQQGNVVTEDMLNKLEYGMSAEKVRFIMGTPLIHDSFHQNRWDYFHSIQQGSDISDQKRISLLFENKQLVAIEGDESITLKESTGEDTILGEEPVL